MRLLLLALAAFSGASGTSLSAAVSEGLHAIRRYKRQASPSGDMMCTLRCATKFAAEAESLKGKSEGMFLNSKQLSTVDETCATYLNSRACFDSCPEDGLKEMILQPNKGVLKAFASLDYLCVEKFAELKQHEPCYESVGSDVEETCEPRCGGSDRLAEIKANSEMATASQDLPRMLSLLGDSCQLLGCHVECQKPIIKAGCPEDPTAATFMQGFTARLMTSSKGLLEQVGLESMWPKRCEALNEVTSESAEDSAISASNELNN